MESGILREGALYSGSSVSQSGHFSLEEFRAERLVLTCSSSLFYRGIVKRMEKWTGVEEKCNRTGMTERFRNNFSFQGFLTGLMSVLFIAVDGLK
ncbi:hypothetical protein R1flu_010497 [Riccia fluitans]|uniref:Uncharacterized protein n=1 Tax=Riccia fluitans TaxID=41844 RepID=A0ABD1Z5B4_9MARC